MSTYRTIRDFLQGDLGRLTAREIVEKIQEKKIGVKESKMRETMGDLEEGERKTGMRRRDRKRELFTYYQTPHPAYPTHTYHLVQTNFMFYGLL